MSAARWERLVGTLAERAGVEARLHARSYSEAVYGRVRHGVSYSITLRRSDGCLVEVHDRWWRKNPDVWIGWEVTLSDRQGFELRSWSPTKKRGEVATAVGGALEWAR